MGKYAQIITFTDDLVVEWKVYREQSEAVKAAGVEA
jgi:hypothetical protein